MLAADVKCISFGIDAMIKGVLLRGIIGDNKVDKDAFIGLLISFMMLNGVGTQVIVIIYMCRTRLRSSFIKHLFKK